MKLHIDIELSPEEIPLATELFNILRQINGKVQTKNLPALFRTLISRLQEPDAVDAVAADINALLTENNTPETFEEFFNAFTEVVFNPELVTNSVSVVPFFSLLPKYVFVSHSLCLVNCEILICVLDWLNNSKRRCEKSCLPKF